MPDVSTHDKLEVAIPDKPKFTPQAAIEYTALLKQRIVRLNEWLQLVCKTDAPVKPALASFTDKPGAGDVTDSDASS